MWLPIPSLDTLLALPSLGYFILPSALSTTSLSTYLNILFFTLTWSTVVLSHDPVGVEFFTTLTVHILFYFLPSLAFLLFDFGLPSVSLSIKSRRSRGLAQRSLSSSRNAAAKLIGVSALNLLISTTLQTTIDQVLTHYTPFRSALRIPILPPTPWSILADLTRAYIVRGLLAYYIHRFLLHAPRSPYTSIRALSRYHLSWQHSLRTAIPFAATYDHPAAYLLNSFVPTYVSAFLFRPHILSHLLFLTLVDLEDALTHSGYTLLPSTILLAGIARRREAHYETRGGGNFGPWGVMDWVHGSSLGDRDVLDDVMDEARKRDVKGKAQGVVSDVQDRVQRGGNVVREQLLDEDDEDEDEPVQAAGRRGLVQRVRNRGRKRSTS